MGERDDRPISVRLPPDLKVTLRQVAELNERSLNKEILVAIRAHVRREMATYTQREDA